MDSLIIQDDAGDSNVVTGGIGLPTSAVDPDTADQLAAAIKAKAAAIRAAAGRARGEDG